MASAYLKAPATRADVIGWCLTLPLVVWVGLSLPMIYGLPAKYTEVFAQFDVALPFATRVVLKIGGPGLAAIFGLLALTPVVVMLRSSRSWPKLATPLACGFVAALVNSMLLSSLFGPVAQIMAQLPEGPK